MRERDTSADEDVAALEAEPPADDVGPAAGDDPDDATNTSLPDQAPGGPSPAGEDPEVLGPDQTGGRGGARPAVSRRAPAVCRDAGDR